MRDTLADTNLLATCREIARREVESSPEARAIYGEFYEAWFPQVESWALARIGPFYAQDLVVETFWRAWQWTVGHSELPAEGPLLRTCLERAYVDLMRHLYGRYPTQESNALPARGVRNQISVDRGDEQTRPLIEAIADTRDVEIEVLERERSVLVQRGLEALPPQHSNCVRCRYLLGMSVRDTASELQLTVDQVKKYTAAGLARLALLIRESMGL